MTEEEMNNFCDNMELQRILQGMTRRELAKGRLKAGVIRQYEYKRAKPLEAHISFICDRLNVPYEKMIAPPDYKPLFMQAETRKLVYLYSILPRQVQDVAMRQLRALAKYGPKRKTTR